MLSDADKKILYDTGGHDALAKDEAAQNAPADPFSMWESVLSTSRGLCSESQACFSGEAAEIAGHALRTHDWRSQFH